MSSPENPEYESAGLVARPEDAIVLAWPSREALLEAAERAWGPGWQADMKSRVIERRDPEPGEPEAGP